MADDQRDPSGVILDYRSAAAAGVKPDGPRRPHVRTFGEELCKLAALATLFVYYGLHGNRSKPIGLFFAAGWLIWAAVVVAWVISWVRGRRWERTKPRPTTLPPPRVDGAWGVEIVTALVATLFLHGMSLEYHTCPHGQRWANPYLGVARSGNGGPCGNGPLPRGRHVWHVRGEWYLFVVQ
jgi:hypothetical protein